MADNEDRKRKLEQLRRWGRQTPLQEEFARRRREDTANTEDMDDEEYTRHWNATYGDLDKKAKK